MKKVKLKTEAVNVDCKAIEIHEVVYNKLESWKNKVFPYGCDWTTFINQLVDENEQRYLDNTQNRIEKLRLLEEETYLRKSMNRGSEVLYGELADCDD